MNIHEVAVECGGCEPKGINVPLGYCDLGEDMREEVSVRRAGVLEDECGPEVIRCGADLPGIEQSVHSNLSCVVISADLLSIKRQRLWIAGFCVWVVATIKLIVEKYLLHF